MASTASQVQVLLGTKNELFRELYAPLLSNIIAHFTTIEVDYTKVKELFTDGKPRVVLAVDGHLTRRNYEGLHAQLAEYTKGGGAVICCCNFSSFCRPPDLNRFLARFGFQWKCGDYQRTTFAVNIAFKHIFGASAFSELETSCSMKALHVANVPCDDRIYGPTSMSRTESRVFPAESVDQSQSPAALGRCGEGYLGYLGDVNNEECSQALLMVMIRSIVTSSLGVGVSLPAEVSTGEASSSHEVDGTVAGHNPGCHTCGVLHPAKECGRCRGVQYCSTACQRADWREHKQYCNETESSV